MGKSSGQAQDADNNEINGDDVIKQGWSNQYQYSGDQREEGVWIDIHRIP
jgi:hypothetical protein